MITSSRQPLVSVIIPSYNHENFVEEAIHSALNQTIQDVEVIIIDDGSSDGTVAKIESINDLRLNFTSNPENRTEHVRNKAILQARGKYIAFLNSDDAWEKNKLELQLADFESHSNLAASFTRVAMMLPDSTLSVKTWAQGAFESKNKTSAEWLRFFFETGNDLCISSALIPRVILDEVGLFDESLVQLSDIDMWIRIAQKGHILIHEKSLTKMRINGTQNLSAPNPNRDRRSAIELTTVLNNYTSFNLAEVFFDLIPDSHLSPTIQQAILAKHAWSRSPSHIAFGDALFAALLKDSSKRSEIVAFFGVDIIHSFLSNRTRMEVVIHD